MLKESFYPSISVVTPSFNQGKYLEKTIQSVLDQNYPNLEHIIIDGGSTDGSVEIIKKHEKHLKFWVSESDHGQSHAINKGISNATGELLTWLNSDDYYMPGALHTLAESSLAHPASDVFVGIGQVVDEAGRIVYYKKPEPIITLDSLYHWMSGGDFMQPSCVFRRKAWESAGPLDEDLHIALDVDLWLRMAVNKCQFMTVNELISTSLSHKHAKTTAFKNLMIVDCAIVVTKHGGALAVRNHLEEMAKKLSWYEAKLRTFLAHPMMKVFKPLINSWLKPRLGWQNNNPPWEKHRKHLIKKK